MSDAPHGLPPVLEPFALAIGTLCYEWADCEVQVCDSLAALSKMPKLKTARAIFKCFDFRAQLAAIRLAAVEEIDNQACVDAIFATIDYIDNTLRNRRNRYIHDYWLLGGGVDGSIKAYQTTYAAKAIRPQSRQPRVLRLEIRKAILHEIKATTSEVELHSRYLAALIHGYLKGDRALPKLLARPPQRRLVPLQSETPRP